MSEPHAEYKPLLTSHIFVQAFEFTDVFPFAVSTARHQRALLPNIVATCYFLLSPQQIDFLFDPTVMPWTMCFIYKIMIDASPDEEDEDEEEDDRGGGDSDGTVAEHAVNVLKTIRRALACAPHLTSLVVGGLPRLGLEDQQSELISALPRGLIKLALTGKFANEHDERGFCAGPSFVRHLSAHCLHLRELFIYFSEAGTQVFFSPDPVEQQPFRFANLRKLTAEIRVDPSQTLLEDIYSSSLVSRLVHLNLWTFAGRPQRAPSISALAHLRHLDSLLHGCQLTTVPDFSELLQCRKMDYLLYGSKFVGPSRTVDIGALPHLTELGKSCFFNCKNVEKVVLPSILEVIGPNFCYDATALSEIDFGVCAQSLRSVNTEGFLYNTALTTFDTTPLLGKLGCAVGKCFLSGCEYLVEINLAGLCGVTELAEGFLAGCAALERISCTQALSGVTRVGDKFLADTEVLEECDLGALTSLTSLGQDPLSNSLLEQSGLEIFHEILTRNNTRTNPVCDLVNNFMRGQEMRRGRSPDNVERITALEEEIRQLKQQMQKGKKTK